MTVALITGSAGLIGSEAVTFFAEQGLSIVGIDNNFRKKFFGDDACTQWNLERIQSTVADYKHNDLDIRDKDKLESLFKSYGKQISVIIHSAAQPSHDWAASDPFMDFSVNADATLNLLEFTRRHCPDAVFIFLSTNKVYGDTPNTLPLDEHPTRWEIAAGHRYYGVGIDEKMSIDSSKHSLFGASKLAADVLVQEYGRYFGLKTACFRAGCLTGPAHSGTKLHGFLAYLMRCVAFNEPYSVFGYKAKQVRDNIHSYDLVNALWHFYQQPKSGVVYNIGGGPKNACSVLEAIKHCEKISGEKLNWQYVNENRIGDHIWWITDVRKFQADYPSWQYKYSLFDTLKQIHNSLESKQALA